MVGCSNSKSRSASPTQAWVPTRWCFDGEIAGVHGGCFLVLLFKVSEEAIVEGRHRHYFELMIGFLSTINHNGGHSVQQLDHAVDT
jgi:hypothetical protein